MDADDLDLFARSVQHAVTSAADAVALDATLADLGWAEALAEAPREATATLFAALGEAAATSSALHRLVAHTLTGAVDAPGALLPPLGTWNPPGRVVGGHTEVSGLANAALLAGGRVTVAVTTDSGVGHVGHVVVGVADLDVRPVSGLDPDAGLALVTGSGPVPAVDAAVDWDEAVRLGRLAVSHELQGASRAILALAREHALDRIQFGQPIAAFQAVRHKLAEVLITIETTDALLDAAWRDPGESTACMAKGGAGRSARLATRHGQQVLAGIGFTLEHDLHRYVRRVLVLDEILGSSRTLTKDLGTQLLATRRLPPLLPL